jgi:hypothetical protein
MISIFPNLQFRTNVSFSTTGDRPGTGFPVFQSYFHDCMVFNPIELSIHLKIIGYPMGYHPGKSR